MQAFLGIMKLVAVLAAAVVIGNWFLSELRKARRAGAPWYQPYLTIPGIIIIVAVLLPLILRITGLL